MSIGLEQLIERLNALRAQNWDVLDRCARGALTESALSDHFDAQWRVLDALLPKDSRAYEVHSRAKPTWRNVPEPRQVMDCEPILKHDRVLVTIIAEMERQLPGSGIIPSPETYFLETPLYETLGFTRADARDVLRIEFFDGTLDCYCGGCGAHSVFQSTTALPNVGSHYGSVRPVNIESFVSEFTTAFFLNGGRATEMSFGDYATTPRVIMNQFVCTRSPEHGLYFISRVLESTLIKIGQHPSLADLRSADTKKYRKILGSQYGEFNRAIGLASHGVGVGAFVYLRRIFERLLTDAYARAKQDPNWPSEDEWERKRIVEKIPLLAAELPEFVVQNVSVYGILSKAIHSLSEQECLQHFDAVRLAIELILDQELERQAKEEKISAARKAVLGVSQQIGGTGA